MFGASACSLSVGGKVRCMDAVLGEKSRAQFLVGTSCLLQANQVQLVEYDAAASDVAVKRCFRHPGEIRHLAPSPQDATLLVTIAKPLGQPQAATLWKMPVDAGEPQDAAAELEMGMEALSVVPAQKAPVSKVVWNPNVEQGGPALASAHETLLRTWSLETAAMAARDKLDVDQSLVSASVSALAWDPHDARYLSFALGGGIQTWDVRGKAVAFSIEDAHTRATLDVDYNPNRPFALVSGGEDGCIKFWDLRRAARPLLTQAAHSHWVWQARYNRCHDQLVLSASSDSSLALWRISSISSAPLVELDEQDLMSDTAAGSDVADSKVQSYDEHEDSVYAVAWAASDAWAFASVSYDGRLAVHQVPSTEKYKILL